MTGKYRHGLDAKGRLAIPAKLRESTLSSLGQPMTVTRPSMNLRCISP